MKKLLVLPTWLIIKFLIPFVPEGHPWKGRKFSLADWSEHSTPLNNQFGVFFWIVGISIFIMVAEILNLL